MAELPSSVREPELERALLDLGRQLAYPPTPDFAARIRQDIAVRPAPATPVWAAWLPNQRRLAVALLALIAAAAAVLALSPTARAVVAERLGLRGVLIRDVADLPTLLPTAPAAVASPSASPSASTSTEVPTPAEVSASPAAAASAGARLSLGQALNLADARARVGFQIPLPTTLGPPDEVYVLDAPPGGQVALVYYPRPNLPQANTTGVGLLLTAFQGTVPTGMFGKGVPPGTHLEELRINGGQGYWIEGNPHTLFLLDSRGRVRTETTRLAANVLLWEQGSLTVRLESSMPKDRALAIAASIR